MSKRLLSLVVCFLWIAVVAAAADWEKGPVDSLATPAQNDAMWDVQFSFDLTAASGAAGNAGCEFDGTYFYSTRWASNLIHQYDINGVLVKEFSIAGVTGLRDLAYDGTHFYGGAAGGTIYQMDFTSETLIGNITGSFQSRAIAYDSDLDVFYCSNWGDPVYIVNRSGAVVGNINLITTTSTYGLAYDNLTAGGPFLWVHDQTAGGSVIHQWDLAAGAYTGVTHDVSADFATGGIAGGLFLTTDYLSGTITIGGLLQGVPDIMVCYELGTTAPAIIIDDGDPQFMSAGPWNAITPSVAYNGTVNWKMGGTGTAWAGFRVDGLLSGSGTYDCSVWVPQHPFLSFMSTNVLHKVYHATGTTGWLGVDQSVGGDQWISLGSYTFDDTSGPQGVILIDAASGIVLADAAKFQ
jgi:hypothetical protein